MHVHISKAIETVWGPAIKNLGHHRQEIMDTERTEMEMKGIHTTYTQNIKTVF